MTLFEKIYWTCLVINIVLFSISCLDDEIELFDILEWDADWLKCFLVLQCFLTFCYWIVKVICWIWGVHISLFPSIK